MISFVYENWGFDRLFQIMSGGAALTFLAALFLPGRISTAAPAGALARRRNVRACCLVRANTIHSRDKTARNIMPAPRTIIVTAPRAASALPAWKPCWRRATMCAASTETP